MSDLQQDQRATDAMLYSMKPSAVSSRSYRDSISAINGNSHASGTPIKINIPAGRKGTYLDCSQSYIKFKVDNTTGAVLTLSGSGAWVFIQRLDVYHGSNLLESINEYGRLHQALYDMGMNMGDKDTAGTFEGSIVQTYTTPATFAGSTIYSLDEPNRIGVNIASGADETFYIPLVSGVVGQLVDKYIPLGEMSADLRLEFTLYQANIAGQHASTAPAWNIVDFTYEAQIVEVDGNVQQEIDQATLGYYRIHGTSWGEYNTTVASGDGSKSFLIPARYASLKNLLVVQQNQAIANGATATHAIACRTKANMSKYQFKVGSLQVPQTPVELDATGNLRGAEGFAELKKSFHSMGVLDGGLIASDMYVDDSPDGTTNVECGSFLVGQELESFAHKNDVLTAGVNTLSSNVFFEATYSSGAQASVNLYAFAHYDLVLELQGGVMRVRK